MKIFVVIPTYNEADTIGELISEILALKLDADILVVDDHSPDGTAELIRKRMEKEKRIHLLERPKKMGLGSAYLTGFRFALEKGAEIIFEMDGDLSHHPQYIVPMIEKLQEADLVIGSRYIKGVSVVDWPMGRLLLSYCANRWAEWMTAVPVRDMTSGFKGFRREALLTLDFSKIRSDGYSFQIEVNVHLYRKKFRLVEFPIIFRDRNIGVSKMTRSIVLEAFVAVWRHFFERVFRRF
ncbi:MAG: polyprenol monophosphomannose synthase [Candidatus Omnitrophica bacterium]|nr:polyprenol monophosphomannose synthase [Candidatus Omnitrophota bacterium]